MKRVLPPAPWQGRNDQDQPEQAKRWHHQVEIQTDAHMPIDVTHGLIGFCCDAGVRRNHGRPGAAEGPAAFRRQLANLACHDTAVRLGDFGDVIAEGDELEAAQATLANSVAQVLSHTDISRLLVVGGGHETAWGSFCGLYQALGPDVRIGIINLDAHFDLRKPEALGPSSGTPFYQIRELVGADNFFYTCLGVAQESNTATLFQRATEWGVHYRADHEMTAAHLPAICDEIDAFAQSVDALYLTIDLDVLPHYQAPGVSAPASRGVSLAVIEAVIAQIKQSAQHCRLGLPLVELTELNPSCDLQGVTARTAAILANALLSDSASAGKPVRDLTPLIERK